ncbi:MAG: hypothetical protein IJU76_00590 [Desulfovibrionaceae bacterium]|nr:hypothetical protein [Desulfovibrionaceae bacterium]
MVAIKRYTALLCLLLLVSCAGKTKEHALSADPKARWQEYLADKKTTGPFRLTMSLRLGTKGDTRRVTALLWGNDATTLRLDVMAGIGSTIAKVRSTPTSFLLVAPVDKKAFAHNGTNQPRLKLGGIPLPLSVQNVAAILNGSYTEAFGTEYTAHEEGKNGAVRYSLAGPLPGSLELDGNGNPHIWRGNGGWIMTMVYDETKKPVKLELHKGGGEQFVLFVKEREETQTFTDDQLSLAVPPSFPILPLKKYAEHQKLADR